MLGGGGGGLKEIPQCDVSFKHITYALIQDTEDNHFGQIVNPLYSDGFSHTYECNKDGIHRCPLYI